MIEVLPLHGEQITCFQQLLEGGGIDNTGLAAFTNGKQSFPCGTRTIGVGRDGDGTGFTDSCDGVKQAFAGDSITAAARSGVPHSPKQTVHIRASPAGIEQCQKMETALHR